MSPSAVAPIFTPSAGYHDSHMPAKRQEVDAIFEPFQGGSESTYVIILVVPLRCFVRKKVQAGQRQSKSGMCCRCALSPV